MSPDGSAVLKLLAQELGKLPNHMAIEGHTDSKPYPPTATYTNWKLSSDRRECRPENHADGRPAAGSDFAGSRIRRPAASEARSVGSLQSEISLIVQYTEKTKDDPAGETDTGGAEASEKGKKTPAAAESKPAAPPGGGKKECTPASASPPLSTYKFPVFISLEERGSLPLLLPHPNCI